LITHQLTEQTSKKVGGEKEGVENIGQKGRKKYSDFTKRAKVKSCGRAEKMRKRMERKKGEKNREKRGRKKKKSKNLRTRQPKKRGRWEKIERLRTARMIIGERGGQPCQTQTRKQVISERIDDRKIKGQQGETLVKRIKKIYGARGSPKNVQRRAQSRGGKKRETRYGKRDKTGRMQRVGGKGEKKK